MSDRLNRFRRILNERHGSLSQAAQIAMLNKAISRAAPAFSLSDWSEPLSAAAHDSCRKSGGSLVDGWFRAVDALAKAVPDPEDRLYGPVLAVQAWHAGIRYDSALKTADLLVRLSALHLERDSNQDPLPAQQAHRLFLYVMDRLLNVEIGLMFRLENDECLASEMLDNPAVIAAGCKLLLDVTQAVCLAAAEENVEVDNEDIVQLVEYGSHYLWAAYQAGQHGLDADELTAFVLSFDEWFRIAEGLLQHGALAPGVLRALCECDGSDERVLSEGPLLTSFWQNYLRPIIPLPDYLRQVLNAVGTD